MENLLRKNNIMFHEKERKIKAILKDEFNNKCADCNNARSEYISLNNACFICKTCFKRHQKFPLNISKTLKNNLSLLTLKELQYLYFGGNKKLLEFMKYEYPKLIKLSPSFAYKTIAMEYYRNWLKYLIEGGNKPQKPDIEIAYKSIEDKEFVNKYLNNDNNNENNVITIDFFNDCYNYNDKYNRSITNFINKKNNKTNNNNNINNHFRNRRNFETENNFYLKMSNSNSNNIKDFLNYYKDINKDNYNKYINTQTIDIFSHTQSNFMPKKKIIEESINIHKNNREKSQEDIIMDDNKIRVAKNIIITENNKNINNEKVIRAFKTNNKIYIKPKHNIVKSFDKNPIIEQKLTNLIDNKKNNVKEIIIERNKDKDKDKEEKKKSIEVIKIRVKRGSQDKKYEINKDNKEDKDKDSKKEYKDKIIEKMKMNNNKDYIKDKDKYINNIKKNDDNYIQSKGKILGKVSKKQFSYNLSNLNIIDNKNNIENNNNNNVQTNINEVSPASPTSPLNIIFKKKSLNNNNNLFVSYDKNSKRTNSTVEHSQFAIISKNKMNTTNDEIKNYDENNDDSVSYNTTRTLTSNKSMKHFYSRYPRKMNKTKTKRKKFNEYKNKDEKKEKDKTKDNEKDTIILQKLKKEKSEIIQSLKILLKKKDELSKPKLKKENEEEENEDDEEREVDSPKNNNIKINQKNINNNNKDDTKNIKKIKNNENEENDYEEEKINKHNKNSKEKKQIKKIYVQQSQDFINKGSGKDSIRGKYKKKNYKYSEM